MNIKQIKERYTCLDYLGADRVVRQGSYGYLCRCPWREDAHPSLSISPNGKGWIDQSTGEHGNIIDLVAKCIGTNDLSKVCAEFDSVQPNSFSFPSVKTLEGGKEEGGAFAQFCTVPMQSRGLFAYLTQRGIDTTIAKNLCQEARYSFQEREDGRYLYALAYPNDKGGFELRSSSFKGSKAPKGITTHLLAENAPYVVFEGFFDMLSFATLCKGIRHNYIVLNSVVNVDAAIEVLQSHPGNKVFLCLDNDPAGNDTTRKMLDALPAAIDIRARISPHKDVNDYLLSTLKNA